jgi:hypothetical protein
METNLHSASWLAAEPSVDIEPLNQVSDNHHAKAYNQRQIYRLAPDPICLDTLFVLSCDRVMVCIDSRLSALTVMFKEFETGSVPLLQVRTNAFGKRSLWSGIE